jgi:hypothetical protein
LNDERQLLFVEEVPYRDSILFRTTTMASFDFDTYSSPVIGNDILDIGLRRRGHRTPRAGGGASSSLGRHNEGPVPLGMTEAELLGRPGQFDLPAVPDVRFVSRHD